MKNKISIGILWADPYNKNLGVGALAYSSLALIYDVVKEKGIEAEFSFVCRADFKYDELSLRGQKINFYNFPALDYLNIKSIIKLLLFPSKFQTKRLLGFDYVFDISAGDSFADIYGKKRFYQMLNTKSFFNKLGKTQVLLPQTIGPFKDKKFEKEAFDLMAKLRLVISRDKQSFDYSQKFLPANKITEAIDVAFYLPFEKSKYDNKLINVGINVSGLLWAGGYTRDNQFEMKSDYRKLIIDTLTYFTSQPNVLVHLVPHVVPENSPVEDDYAASEDIRNNFFNNVVVAPRFTNPIEAKSYISGLDFFTGARMHACIGAFSAEVPVYLMAYSRKFNGLFKDTLRYKWMGDCVNENEAEVFEGLKQAFEHREEMKAQIITSLNTIAKPRLDQLKTLLSEIIN